MQYPRSDSNYQGDTENCEAMAPFVMSLFDGEADEFEAKQARIHLLICQTCAHRWLDWNRSRDLLCSIPVPAPPPTQLWRVLMACRLAGFSQQRSKKKANSGTNYNGAPTDLSAQILARTTRTTAPSAPVSTASKWRGLGMPAVAVPVMAMWLLVLQREPFIATVPFDRPANLEQVLAPRVEPRPAPRRLLRAVVAPRGTASPVKVGAQPRVLPTERIETEGIKEAVPRRAVRETPMREVTWARIETVRREVAPVEVAPREVAPREMSRVEERPSETAPQVAPVRLVRATPEFPPVRRDNPVDRNVTTPVSTAVTTIRSTVAAPQFVTVALNTVDTPVRPRAAIKLRTASLSDDENQPRLRTARWKIVAPTASPAVPVAASAPSQIMRVSLPTSRGPAPAPTRLLAENFEGYDGRVEEMRSVVDDFRASLAPDSTTTSDTDEDLSRN